MKLIYLDFDGVLHDSEVYYHSKRGIYIETPGRFLFEWMHILEDLLAPYPEVSLVLSTSWVKVRSFDFAKSQLSKSLQEKVIGATFHQRYFHRAEFSLLSRGEQIEQDVLYRKPSSWFAIDDDAVYWPEYLRGNLIHTNGTLGISEHRVQKAIHAKLREM